MTASFPNKWSQLKFPHTRAELLQYLKDASSLHTWSDTPEIEFLVHFIFDDHDFRPTERLIGDVLLNAEEAAALAVFIETLDRAIGPRSKGLSKLTHEDWNEVAAAAAATHAAMLRAGVPRNG